MASLQAPVASSGSDGDQRYANLDERKRKRMISNRESARRSRMKKQQRVDELIQQTSQFQKENKLISQKIDSAVNMFVGVANDNNVIRAQMTELTERLHSLNSVLRIAEEVSGLTMDIPEIPDGLMEPWQLPRPMFQISASSDDLFQY